MSEDKVAPSMRLKWLRDGVQDFEYVQILRNLGYGDLAVSQIRSVALDWHTWTRDPAELEAVRDQLGREIEDLCHASAIPCD